MLRTTGVGQKIVELLKRRTVNCRTSGIAPIHRPTNGHIACILKKALIKQKDLETTSR